MVLPTRHPRVYRGRWSFMPGGAIGGRAMSSPPLLSFPSEPVTDRAAHDQLEVAALQPGQLFGEQRHALTPRARHARDVGAPEPARGAEGVVEAAQVGGE